MHVLLINHSLYTGGVETLIVRMANWLVRNGHGCSILLRDTFDGDLVPMLDPKVNLRVVANQWDLLVIPWLGMRVWKSWNLPKPDFIYTMEQNWSPMGLIVQDLFGARATTVATGAYHLNQFAYEYVPKKWGKLALFTQDVYNRYYSDFQKIFMSEETRLGHEVFFDRKIPDGWVWPLPIEIPSEETSRSRKPISRRIVTIGRLTRFKTYSWYMVPILYALRQKYPEVQWHVYGFGQCERELVDAVWKDAIRDGLIVFHGPISYHDISSAFAEAEVFIGMGTTLLEAAAAGTPSIPALVDDDLALSWGFIEKMPYFTVGETIPGMDPPAKVSDLIEQLFQSSPREKEEIITAGRDYVSAYSIDVLMERLLFHAKEMNCGTKLSVRFKIRYLFIRSLKLIRNSILSFQRIGKPYLRHPSGDRLLH